MPNKNLNRARAVKNDEFYTQLPDIESELKHYAHHFKGKVVCCNCDDPKKSNFFYYFFYNFQKLGIKKLITTCYKSSNPDLFSKGDSARSVYLVYAGGGATSGQNKPNPKHIGVKQLKGDGDFAARNALISLNKLTLW